jgi:pimeloyl-ACP methyl ester carboxylesterase
MTDFWLWAAVTIASTSIIVLIVSYLQSRHILKPSGYRNPVGFFPDKYNLIYENVTFNTCDNVTLKGWFISAEKQSEKTIVLLHGWAGNKSNVLQNTYFLHKLGVNLFCFDFRGCGESGGNVSTIGYLEIKDFKAALEFLKTHKSQESKKIGIYSISMGASVAIYQAPKSEEIKCLITEAAFTSYEQIVARWAWIRRKIPYYPCVPLTLFFVRLKLKINPEHYSPVYHISKVSGKPIFFIHGSHDDLVLPKDAKILFKKVGEPKSWWLVAGASHGKCAETGGKDYKNKLRKFFKDNL